MVEYTGREVLLKDENGEVIIPYVSYASQGRNIGDIFYTTRLDAELNGAVECNGGTYNTSDFSGSQSIGNLLSGGKIPYVSLTEYASIVSSNGSCRAFGWDGGTSFRVPLLNDVYIEAGIASSAGEFIKESLPNITGTLDAEGVENNSWSTHISGSGAFYDTESKSCSKNTTEGSSANKKCNFDASRSSSTYQNGAKVKPDSVRYRAMVQLAITATEDAVITATSALQQLANVTQTMNNKAEVDLSNVSNIASSTSSLISGLGMPSERYIDLTLGASGTKYTAPANGFFAIVATTSNKTSNYKSFVTHSRGGRILCTSYGHASGGAFLPCKKGDSITFDYESNVTDQSVRFIYAEGEN